MLQNLIELFNCLNISLFLFLQFSGVLLEVGKRSFDKPFSRLLYRIPENIVETLIHDSKKDENYLDLSDMSHSSSCITVLQAYLEMASSSEIWIRSLQESVE
jgi:hypothetical protein